MNRPLAAGPVPSLRHLAALSDRTGLFEHALLDRPRRQSGYCTDDAGRLLALTCRLPGDPHAARLAELAVRFLERAHLGAGRFRLRLSGDGYWTTEAPSDDANGRALLGLGTATGHAPWPDVRRRAAQLFDAAVEYRCGSPRAVAYAVIGAAEALRAVPGHPGAHRLLSDALPVLPVLGPAPGWRWPEARLAYANAVLAEARIAAGVALDRWDAVAEALDMLAWLIEIETLPDTGRFSFTPVTGRGPDGPAAPAFDQQPIEAAAMAEACARAFSATGVSRWAVGLARAVGWFLGGNDAAVPMYDPTTGGGYDGLGPDGVNRNQGAESTIASVAALTQLERLRSGELTPRQPVGTGWVQAACNVRSRPVAEAVAAPRQRSAAP